jgi:predicted short-subunit dehydrogenase-like oxidoreductase (DUF2520 family)
MKISFIGSGNVAWHLAQAFEDSGNQICEIYSRNLLNARQLVKKLFDAKAVNELDFADSVAELFVLSVKDDAIAEVLDELILPENAILVHTSGSNTLEILENWLLENDELGVKIGVFYPLMSFSKDKKLQFIEVPLCIEAADQITENILVNLGQKISKIVYLVDSEERKILHLSAVFANNFVNHLLAITQDILLDNDLDMNLIRPIIKETIAKALAAEDIYDVQTGPARRGDAKLMKTQIMLLKNKPNAEKIYRVLSESIMNYYNPD